MKTRRFAIAFDKGRVGTRRAQACGFVSRTMTRRAALGPTKMSDAGRGQYLLYDLLPQSHSAPTHLPCPLSMMSRHLSKPCQLASKKLLSGKLPQHQI